MWLDGYRNLIIGFAYMGLCGWMGYMAGASALPEMGSTFVSLGAGVTGVVFGRGFNKKMENGK